jgi:CHAT domain-containing protein/Tfp pilus assembly protein PilF
MFRARFRYPLCTLVFAFAFLLTAPPPLRAIPDDTPKPTPEVQALLDKAEQAEAAYKHNDALRLYNEALAKAHALQDKPGEAWTLTNVGVVYYSTGQPQKALECFEQALPLHRSVGDRIGEADTLNNIGNAYGDIGRSQKALECLQQALVLYRAVGDRRGEAEALTSIGAFYFLTFRTGQPQKALEYFQQALQLYRAVGDRKSEAVALNNIGVVYWGTGQQQKALEFLRQALPLRCAVGDRAGEARTLGNIGYVYSDTRQPQKALSFLRQALPLHRSVGDRHGEAVTLHFIGNVFFDTGQPQRALQYYQRALALHRQTRKKGYEADTLTQMATVSEARGNLAEADQRLQTAIRLLEGIRESLGGLSESKGSFLASRIATYHRSVSLLLKRQKPADAFALAQKTKARTLLDLMCDGKVDLRRGLTDQEREREAQLRHQADDLNRQMVFQAVTHAPDAGARLLDLHKRLAQAERDLAAYTESLYARHPDLAQKRAARTVTLADVPRFLPSDAALLEYVVLQAGTGKEKLDRTVLFVVTARGGKAQVSVFPLSLIRSELTERADDFREACADPTKSYRAKARDLYRLLLAPAEKMLAGRKRLIVCPDGPLWGLPFQALLTPEEHFLLDRYEISYAYSATAAQAALLAKSQSRRLKPAGTLLAMANPDFGGEERFGSATEPVGEQNGRPIVAPSREGLFLPRGGRLTRLPGTQREADTLKQDFPGASVYTGKEAQEGTAKQEGGKYRYLHFATHGFFNDAAPLMSAIVLALPPRESEEDGFLTAREVFDLDLSAEMVVLSACNTGRGEKRSGEGMVGMTWALFVAGAPTQVVSQWSVDDASTATLMERFYSGIKRGEAKGAALRQAALSLRKDGQHAHPYYWAPFVLVGDWR